MDFNITDKERTKAIRYCRLCLDGVWKEVAESDISVARLSGGMSNMLYRCTLMNDACNNNKSLFRNQTNNKSNDTTKVKSTQTTQAVAPTAPATVTQPAIKSTKVKVPSDVLLRFYGPANSDTETQLEVFRKLAREKLGPKLYAEFEGGRLEEYLPSTTLTWHDMIEDNVSSVIAKKIASIHKLDLISCVGVKEDWLLNQYQEYHDFLLQIRKKLPEFKNCSESTKKLALDIIDTDYVSEIDYLSKLFKKSKAPLVFSHNDLHQNNIIVLHDANNTERKSSLINPNKLNINNKDNIITGQESENCYTKKEHPRKSDLDKTDIKSLYKRIVLIDFEYCSYNYRTFDVANHMNEWCFDYSAGEYPYFRCRKDRFPSEERQRQFLREYAEQMLLDNSVTKDSDNDSDECDEQTNENSHPSDKFNDKCSTKTIDDQNNLNTAIEMLLNEMQPFLMASNLLWTLWSIKSACTSKITFGYWEMAKCRMDMYKICKKNYESSGKCRL